MGDNDQNIEYVLSSLRYESAPLVDEVVPIYLEQKQQLLEDTDRNTSVSLSQLYNTERQESTIFRPAFKLVNIFNNQYDGDAVYTPFLYDLYYSNLGYLQWKGYPQYKEFDFIRLDTNISGYTTNSGSTAPHVSFINKSASTYNWNVYLTYASSNNSNKLLQYFDNFFNYNITWLSGDGIPFVIQNGLSTGSQIISFYTPMAHGLSVGQYVLLSISYNGQNLFQVDSIGDVTYNSSKYVFNVRNIGYTGDTFNNFVTGTFKRIVDVTNSADTICSYYIRNNKTLTDVEDSILVNSGFESNPFNTYRHYEYSALTPNHVGRVSQKEGNQSYTVTFSKDMDVSSLRDNLNRPVTELFLTVVNKGYFGWFNLPDNPAIPGSPALKYGLNFNISQNVNNWWSRSNSNSWSNIPTSSYVSNGNVFYYNRDLPLGFEMDGDLCEWSPSEYQERVISNGIHKFTFNPNYFLISSATTQNQSGYTYQIHNPIELRDYSSAIQTADSGQVSNIPNYAFYSPRQNAFIWRDIYEYGYIDTDGVGVDFPFLNGTHYPYQDVYFRIIPDGANYSSTTVSLIVQPSIDGCV